MSEKERSIAERLNELIHGLDERGQDRLLEYADGYLKGYQTGRRDAASSVQRDTVYSTV